MEGSALGTVPVSQETVRHFEESIHLPPGVATGTYRIRPPLVKPSRLTAFSNGGVGKNLSDGWCLNFAVGCTHACPFCYVDEIHKRFGRSRFGDIVAQDWGNYLLLPENLTDVLEKTPWERWAGEEVMMSSTHDPYLPKLARAARDILGHALPAGVKICLQTRSYLVTKDLAFLASFPEQVRLQISIATTNRDLSRLIEPRVPTPEARFEVLRQAKRLGLNVGVILAPILPPIAVRHDVAADIRVMARTLAKIDPQHIFGESLHVRGQNLRLLEDALGEPVHFPAKFDTDTANIFHRELGNFGLRGTWWPA